MQIIQPIDTLCHTARSHLTGFCSIIILVHSSRHFRHIGYLGHLSGSCGGNMKANNSTSSVEPQVFLMHFMFSDELSVTGPSPFRGLLDPPARSLMTTGRAHEDRADTCCDLHGLRVLAQWLTLAKNQRYIVAQGRSHAFRIWPCGHAHLRLQASALAIPR